MRCVRLLGLFFCPSLRKISIRHVGLPKRGYCAIGAEVRAHPVPTYRLNKRADNSGPTKATVASWCYSQAIDEKWDTIMKKIAVIFALGFAFTTCMAVATVVASIA
jgi:hypothetical protein